MAGTGRDELRLSQEVHLEGSPGAVFLARVLERDRPRVRIEDWSTSARSLDGLGDPILLVSAEGREQGVFDREGTLVQLSLLGGHVYAAAADEDEGRLESALRALRELLPPPDPSSTHEVTVTFWTYGPHGPQPSWRSISVPAWEEIRENYADPTRSSLEPIMVGFEPARGGQLILWHGKAGTGKTFGLRALAWEWHEWCEFHYIVDPDSFFGQHADYLISVLLQPAHVQLATSTFAEIRSGYGHLVVDDENGAQAEKGWKLLMLEDTGELLTADARAVIGQGLSRFLNVVDGLIGQGLRVLVLVTTNEEIRRLHPAVARPGRCAANVEFLPLSEDEAKAWLMRHEVDEEVAAPTNLASLYALAEGLEWKAERAPGFAG